MENQTAREKADRFITEAQQFRLGALLTESQHPRSKKLSQTARRDIADGLGVLFDVDRDVVDKFREWASSGQPERVRDEFVKSLMNGGRVFCTGCGATGRLSIQMVSIWRDLWRKKVAEGLKCSPPPQDWENRAFSVMAGGDFALIKSVEGFEDFTQFGKKQIDDLGVSEGDIVFAITEGGETSFVIGTAWKALEKGAKVYFVYNNPDDVLCDHVIRSREVIQEERIEKINLTTGPMAITGSTRMQATSIQLCVMLTIFEMALREILARIAPDSQAGASESVPQEFLKHLEEVHKSLESQQLRNDLAKLVEREENVYRSEHKNSYFADALAVDVLTDTTERSPTFCIPAFRKWDDTLASESWSFLFLPHNSSEQAWNGLLKRRPQTVEWSLDDVRQIMDRELAARQHDIIKDIGMNELLRFRIGLDGLTYRPFNPGDSAAAIFSTEELGTFANPDNFFRTQLSHAVQEGASASVVFVGPKWAINKADDYINSQLPAGTLTVYLQVPEDGMLLRPMEHVGVKMLLNALSTCTMVRLGRVMGNVMIWVVPSNLKLIDRSTRYISHLADVPYEEACRMLFEVIEYVTPRMRAGQAYPAPVGVSVMRLKYGLDNEAAEHRLMQELG